MKIKLNKISIQNFFLIGKVNLDFTVGLTLITGLNKDRPGAESNQSGKTSLVRAIKWCIYGTIDSDLTVTSVVNHKAKRPALVSLDFTADEHNYVITRKRTSGKASVGTVKIEQDGQDITPSEDPQRFIDIILGMDYKLYNHVCDFAHDGKFKFVTLTNSEQKTVIENVLDLSPFIQYKNKTKQKLKSLTEIQLNERESEIKSVTKADTLKETLQRTDEQIKAASHQNEEIKKHNEKVNDVIKAIETLTAKHNFILTHKASIVQQKDNCNITDTQFNEEIQKIEKSIEGYKVFSSGSCPMCGQKLNMDSVNKILEDLHSELHIKKGAKSVNLKYISSLQIKLEEKIDEQTTTQSKINKLKPFQVKQSVIDVGTLKKQKDFTIGEMEEAQQSAFISKQEQVKVQGLESHFEFLESAFSRDGIESFLLDSILPYLNERANYYADILSDGILNIKFSTIKKTKSTKKVKDNFHVKVSASNSGECYAECSGSEETFADLAVNLALRDFVAASIGKMIPILLLDEIFASVDSVGSERILNFLMNYSKEKKISIWLISHTPAMKVHYDNRLHMVRKHDVSHLS